MASSAETNSSTETTSTHPSSTLSFFKNVTSLVSIKLDRSNYLLWKIQKLPLLYYQDLYQLVDPKFPIPSVTLIDPTTNQPIENPLHNQCRKTDQLLFSWINATLTEPILSQVVGLNTAREVWDYLESSFASKNVARSLQLRIQLHHMQKGNSTITDYLSKIKNMFDSLAAASQSFYNLDLVLNALRGLGPEYDGFTIAIKAHPLLPTFSKLYALIL
ncbi:hypothetical protein MKX01_020634 [Papaver californicum]|nr:hypothetical protein MKX01_020634 [Papaver californicum]